MTVSTLPPSRTIIVPQQRLGPPKANESGYQATIEQRPPEAGWDRWWDHPVDVFTFVLCVATVLLGVSTTLLWLATQRIAKDSEASGKTQAEKMERSAVAMEGVRDAMAINASEIVRSVDLQRRYGQMQLRPYLTVLVGEGFYQDKNLRFQIRPKILNTGHTPAKDVRWRIGIEVLSPADAETFRYPLPPTIGGNMIAPHQDYLLNALLDRRVDDADAIRDGDASKGIILVYGCVSYRDSMKRRYLTTFAQQVSWHIELGFRGKIKVARLRGSYLFKHNRAN